MGIHVAMTVVLCEVPPKRALAAAGWRLGPRPGPRRDCRGDHCWQQDHSVQHESSDENRRPTDLHGGCQIVGGIGGRAGCFVGTIGVDLRTSSCTTAHGCAVVHACLETPPEGARGLAKRGASSAGVRAGFSQDGLDPRQPCCPFRRRTTRRDGCQDYRQHRRRRECAVGAIGVDWCTSWCDAAHEWAVVHAVIRRTRRCGSASGDRRAETG